MEMVTDFVKHWIDILTTDTKRGPKYFLIFLAGMFTFIYLMQIIDADLWYDHGYASIPTIEEMK